jgi:glutamyl-tRNA synthetase/nondiscriminating glutamyl-tRNA synthetase
MTKDRVRVRFAPSPTGYVHVGNARTALFNWLYARHHGGDFILRIEDTDVERSEARYETQLIADLRWFGLDWDEGPGTGGPFAPYRQSERRELYGRHALELIDRGLAYFCFCTPEELEVEREAALKAGKQPRYSGRCRTRPREEAARKVAEGTPASVRLKIPEGEFAWDDLVHGTTQFSSDVIGDFIVLRSDGNPAYNFAVVVDDEAMQITHVIRGDDHISNTPRQLAVYQAFGWTPPRFAHLSTILGPDRARLSKRHGATSLENFREMGILPEALSNYLALLGWSASDGVSEIFRLNELVQKFSLDRVTKSPAVFDQEKLNWLNRHYMKETPLHRLAELAIPVFEKAGYLRAPATDPVLAWLERVIEAVLKNLDYLSQLPQATRLIFEYDVRNLAESPETAAEINQPTTREVLEHFIPRALAAAGAEGYLSYPRFREIAREVQRQTGKKGRDLFHPIRVAITGASSGPELEKLIPIIEEGSKLELKRPVKSIAARLREFAALAVSA